MKRFLITALVIVAVVAIAAQIAKRNATFANLTGLRGPATA